MGLIRFYQLDALMLFMTDFGLLYAIIILTLILIARKKFKDIACILLTGTLSLEISYLLKIIFQTPRPFTSAIAGTISLTQASGFSMPSLHTAFCFSVLPYLKRIFPEKKHQYLAALVIITIAFSRLYLGVHYLSDLVAGGLIGFTIGKIWIYLEEKYKVIEWFIYHVKDKFELRRQIAHLLIGSSIVFLLKLHLLNEKILLIVLFFGGVLSLVMRRYKIPFLYNILLFFERPADLRHFPGRGSFFLVLGSLLALLFFKRDIALAAITIMAVGDTITTIIGTYFGKIKNPFNPQKHLEGTVLAIFVSTLAALFFVDFEKAFFGAAVGMIFESVTVRYISQIVDDNVIIPLVAGLAMTWMG